MSAGGRIALAVRGLTVGLARMPHARLLVDDLSFEVAEGEMLAFVGESGSGKSLTAAAIFGLLPFGVRRLAGSVRLRDTELTALSERALRTRRGRDMGLVFQNPLTALNPSRGIRAQIAETYHVHRGGTRRVAEERVCALLTEVGLASAADGAETYPHQLSGGMRQRAMIAMALVCDPTLLIADEPTSALDVVVSAQILDLLARLRRERGLTVVFITHDLALAASRADRILVLYAGRAIEEGRAADLLEVPWHPYSRALRDALPSLRGHGGRLAELPGLPPGPGALPPGCRFAPRCPNARDDCRRTEPALRRMRPRFACLHPCQEAP